jgi:hypothetical protein
MKQFPKVNKLDPSCYVEMQIQSIIQKNSNEEGKNYSQCDT